MAKKKTRSQATSNETKVSDLQKKLKKLDEDLVKQINQRARLGQRLRKLEKKVDPSPQSANEVRKSSDAIVDSNQGPLSDSTIRGIYLELLSGIRSLDDQCRVSFLGPKYSYSHLASCNHFGNEAELIPVSTIATVFEDVNRHHTEYGVVPLENSTDGRVSDTLTMFIRLPVKICGEVQQRIHHFLLAQCDRTEIREVYSKPQALSQCREWLAKHLPNARLVEMTSTTAAAQLASEKSGAAAIASQQAGTRYGLNVVAANIEDNKNNVTRFAVIGRDVSEKTGNDKSSLMFELKHAPGALANAMAIFQTNKLNLTWIESFPMSGSKNEYFFFVEFEGHILDTRVKRAIKSLEQVTVRLVTLGSYPQAEISK